MNHYQVIKTKPEDTISIIIECEGRDSVRIDITPTDAGNRFANVRTKSVGGCGTILDPREFENP